MIIWDQPVIIFLNKKRGEPFFPSAKEGGKKDLTDQAGAGGKKGGSHL